MKKQILTTAVLALLLSSCSAGTAQETSQTEYACRAIDHYDYLAPVPYSDAIDESYYADTLFAGDSRMGSLYLYGTHSEAEVAYVTSLNLLLIDTMVIDDPNEKDQKNKDGVTLMNVLENSSRNHIYLLFGINEIRNPNFDAFGQKYQEIIDLLLAKNSAAELYLILSWHPDQISGLEEPALSDQLWKLNSTIMSLAEQNHVYYLDPDNGMDVDGTINDDFVWDGLHLNVTGTHAFEDYIATHVVRRDDYVTQVCE